ncbi:MAG: hypothetical protein ABW095_07400, partial [Candidatus Thiodiazotropha sp.]
RVSSIASRLPGTNRLGFQPSLALSGGNAMLHGSLHAGRRATSAVFRVLPDPGFHFVSPGLRGDARFS